MDIIILLDRFSTGESSHRARVSEFFRMLAVLLVSITLAAPARAATLTATKEGIGIDAGAFGRFVLSYPVLDIGQSEPIKPLEATVEGNRVTLKYVGDVRVAVEIGADGAVTYRFANAPPTLKTYRMAMLIDFGFTEGGTWRMGGAKAVAFPKVKPAKPHLYQGNENRFALTNFEGKSLNFEIPPYSYEELTDNREWNWKIFNWMFIAPYDRNDPQGVVKISQVAAGKTVLVVDRFGQDRALDFPGKVKSEADLKRDASRDEAYYAGFHPPLRDTYGGLPHSKERFGLTQSGFFHVEQKAGHWLLVDPEGNACFHLGICGFQPGDDYTYIKGRTEQYEWLPAYESEYKAAFHPDPYWSRDTFSFYIANLIRKYGSYSPEDLQRRMIHRVRQIGFNAVGAFSGISKADHEAKFPWTSILPLGTGSVGGQIEGLRGLFDPFDPQVAVKMKEAFARDVAPEAGEPLLIGYFLDNEQAFEDIPRVIPGTKASQPAKNEMVQMLQAKYKTIEAFNAAWDTKAESFDALADTALPVTTKSAAADMEAFTGRFIEAYYRLIRDTFRKYDHKHMLIGNRWQPGTANSEQLCRIAGKYCEMLSLNYYTYGIDKPFLKRLYDWSGGRPFMLSEFYWAAPAESGLPGGSEVKTQRERGLAYRNYVEQAASTGFVVGIEWFILIDQARTGRWFEQYNGEKANTGLFSVADRPYKDFLAEASIANYGIYDVLQGKRPAFAWDDPRFQPRGAGPKTVSVPRALGPMKLDGRRDSWPGNPPETVPSSRIVIGADGSGFDGSYRLCWDDRNLYLHVQVNDPTPMRNTQQGGGIWNGDGVELFIGWEEPAHDGPLLFSDRQVLLSAGQPPDGKRSFVNHATTQVSCQVVVTPTVDGHGYVLEAAIPFAALGFTPQPGQTLRFDLAIDDGDGMGRQRQLMWSGGARNSGDRTDWGRAKLVK
jgi:hypothetical protein